MSCQGQTPYYDTTSKICVACAQGSYFSEVTHSCKKIVGEQCTGGRYESSDGICLCRLDTPLFDGQACLACFTPSYFDVASRKCLSCPPGYYHNGVSCIVANCPQTFTFDIYQRRCVCPWYQPKLANNMCNPCPQGQVYNNFTQNCEGCPTGTTITPDSLNCLCNSMYQKFSFATRRCECPYNTPVLN